MKFCNGNFELFMFCSSICYSKVSIVTFRVCSCVTEKSALFELDLTMSFYLSCFVGLMGLLRWMIVVLYFGFLVGFYFVF